MKANDSNTLAILIEQMASQANLPNLLISGPSLPIGWVHLNMFKNGNPPGYPYVQTQGFLAEGPIDGTGTMGAVLALGMPWPNYLAGQFDGAEQVTPLPTSIAGSGVSPDCGILNVYVMAYQALRGPIWDTLGLLNNLPLYIGGMNLGGPLAQIAALDLRPGNTGPKSGQFAPATQPPCYAYSTGNTANPQMAAYYNGLVKNSNVIWAGSQVLPVDLWPTAPADTNFAAMGTLASVPASIPPTDVPWLERSDIFYLQALGGTPLPAAATNTSIVNPPPGFSQSLAYTLSLLTTAAYQLTQHPGSIVNTNPYTLKSIITSNGADFAFVFQSSDTVVVAIRGCVTWLEFNTLTANSNFSHPAFDPNNTADVHSGAYSVYYAPTQTGGQVLFKDALKAQVQALLAGGTIKNLYLTGHSLGGAIANIAAADYAMSSPALPLTALYTFGSTMVANADFQTDFDNAVGSKSYQIRRPNDKIAIAIQMLGFIPVSNQIALNGTLEYDESTYHSLYGYLNLLNPSRPPVV